MDRLALLFEDFVDDKKGMEAPSDFLENLKYQNIEKFSNTLYVSGGDGTLPRIILDGDHIVVRTKHILKSLDLDSRDYLYYEGRYTRIDGQHFVRLDVPLYNGTVKDVDIREHDMICFL